MRQGAETLERGGNGLGGHPVFKGRPRCGDRILQAAPAPQRYVIDGKYRFVAPHDLTRAHTNGTTRRDCRRRKREDPRRSTCGRVHRERIVGVDHEDVVRLLILCDPCLGLDVSLQRPMPIGVIFGDVQEHRDAGREGDRRGELKA
jgi:hypothetical protein